MTIVKQLLPPDQYFREVCDKTQIVLHYTAGQSIRSALDWWKQDADRVGTAFLVGTDGQVVQCFEDPRHWAWHLGVARLFGEKADRQSIGIELVNVGPLTQFVSAKGDGEKNLYWWAEPAGRGKPWATTDDKARVSSVPLPGWRGHVYHAAYPEAQLAATTELVLKLTKDYGINRMVMRPDSLTAHNPPQAVNWRGVLGHHNYRFDKSDPGPWFPWEKLRQSLSA